MSLVKFLSLRLRTQVSFDPHHTASGIDQHGVLEGAQSVWLKSLCVGSPEWIQVNSFQTVHFQSQRKVFMVCVFITWFRSPQVKVNNCPTSSSSFLVKLSHCVSPNCPGTHHMCKACLKLRDLSASDFPMLGLKVCATKPGPVCETFYLSGSMK